MKSEVFALPSGFVDRTTLAGSEVEEHIMHRTLRSLVGALLFVLAGSGDWAQSTAQINWTVIVDGGGVLPGATVVALQTDTGFRREVVTDATGAYTLPNLPIGPY